MNRFLKSIVFLLVFIIFSCNKNNTTKPNVILIMADDMGYECLSAFGSTSYKTPILDGLAANGILFNNCVSQPLCTPSRVKIMTGLYNYRNYDYFGHLKTRAHTFGNLMQDAGYTTCIAGKWQLNGLAYKNEIKDWNDNKKPNKLGFDEYCLWQLTHGRKDGGRFANPLIEQNGKLLERNEDAYGPDIFSDYVVDFIERKKDTPFFVYYPMVLVHDPFVPTPDSEDWKYKEKRYKNDTIYFKDMVAYTDKIVGKITNKLKALKIQDNTIVIFVADNGTHYSIHSKTKERYVQGAKGNTTDGGTHVPLIVSWPNTIKKGRIHNALIEFNDFFATLSDITNQEVKNDGKSFYSLLMNENYKPRNNAFVHYTPRWGKRVNQYRNQFVRTLNYKLYQDGKYYNLKNDILETHPLNKDSITENEKEILSFLQNELKKHPEFK
ncbi:sulfatase-like hydrolase/transferase [Sabulilitoribacter arenilitoris]|uniref:Sulfatase-like hydrolase/transferase n=1 Tax=Wocania arenilitoris TaxID=2044858 RepID=A0AAE3JP60_9FLAO|nr:sulfatase-like hydrolase/transferase [Wocania arenilitoris]MCF7567925.1 sulfatase-like hydrolase/transferase [Wocania arenilitoris]